MDDLQDLKMKGPAIPKGFNFRVEDGKVVGFTIDTQEDEIRDFALKLHDAIMGNHISLS